VKFLILAVLIGILLFIALYIAGGIFAYLQYGTS
jgi:hypothetical protein